MVKWVSVNSTAIRRIGYDFDMSIMYIDFEGRESDMPYCDVPEELFREFVEARSVANFYNQFIKNVYACEIFEY